MLNRDQISSKLGEALGINPEGITDHNTRESWNATVDRVAEFQTKYTEITASDKGRAADND